MEWFKDWFDSPYYHILYKDRNFEEAEQFINNLLTFLKPETNSRFLDLGCGKGRHSVFLNKKKHKVVGLDLSPESITSASTFENTDLQFYVHDMRKVFRVNYFDYVLNLFTSFGYFENNRDDYATINALSKGLKPNGLVVLDFMNATKVISCLRQTETKHSEGIEFKIERNLENGFIVKQICFSDKGKNYCYHERVKALVLADFEKYFAANKLKIVHLFGNYNLQEFDKNTSDRLIIIAQKE